MFVPVGVDIVTVAVAPSQITGLVSVGFGGKAFTVTVAVPSSLVQVFVSVIDNVYVPALLVITDFVVDVATPVGTCQVYVYMPDGPVIVAVAPSQIAWLVSVGFAGSGFTVTVHVPVDTVADVLQTPSFAYLL